ncbi:GNAT family N-acetyltransferase [Bacillus salacetis]|uniref:GNAT family N-acetyltransferase n=1 Tax=Bacillus salacetis TaxID=2315464 RepID=UPI001443D6E7|nr:GNAT family N-acetyltransferase [Bacillus salacetis]
MDSDIAIKPLDKSDREIDRLAESYCLTFIGESFSKQDVDETAVNLSKHTDYPGFRGFKAVDGDGSIAGFAYGYTSVPGQYYREKIQAQLTKEQEVVWLISCFEVVEVAVNPLFRRKGIAGNLLDKLIGNQPHRTALLTTGIENKAAIEFYQNRGWEMLQNNSPVISEGDLQIIYGLNLEEE